MKMVPSEAPRSIPETMRAAVCSDYGDDVERLLTVQGGVPVPRLADLKSAKQRRRSMVIRILAVALAPGDVRVLSGRTRELQGPPGGGPYTPGGDCCGIVVELPDDDPVGGPPPLPFRVGDRVAVGFADGPRGALGEYAIVSNVVADKVPTAREDGSVITSVEAAALVGASPGIFLAQDYFASPDESVLVLGAGGGIGGAFCQRLFHRGHRRVVAVGSAQTKQLWRTSASSLFPGYEFVDYTETDPLAVEKFLQKENRFDVIVDFFGGGYRRLEERMNANEPLPVKTAAEGGRFLTTVPPIGPTFEIHGFLDLLRNFMLPCLWKAFTSRTWYRNRLPAYTFGMAIPMERKRATLPMELARLGSQRAIVDPDGPFPFTTEGVRAAFRKQQSRHAYGKVVIKVADEQ